MVLSQHASCCHSCNDKPAFFYSTENVHAYKSGHVAFFASLIIAYLSLAVSMPPIKVCPQCKAAVPVRHKTCERCHLVFRFKRKAECNLRENSFRWHSSLLAKVTKNANLGYSHDRGLS